MDFSKVYGLENVTIDGLEILRFLHQRAADGFLDDFNKNPNDDFYKKFAQVNCELHIGIRNYLQSVIDERGFVKPVKQEVLSGEKYIRVSVVNDELKFDSDGFTMYGLYGTMYELYGILSSYAKKFEQCIVGSGKELNIKGSMSIKKS